MKKQRKQEKPKVAPKTKGGERWTLSPAGPMYAYVLTSAFFLLGLVGILNHEMWRDEFNAWLVARDAHSLLQLFQNKKYDGNPGLWHLCLYPITSLTSNPVAMQMFHLIVAVAFVFVFVRYAPFSFGNKVLFSLGYFVLYEYALISRGYGIGVLLSFLVCALFKARWRNILPIAVLLFLLSNTTVYGLILSLGFGGILALEYARRKGGVPTGISRPRIVIAALIFLSGVALSLIQIYPEPDNSFPVDWQTGFEERRLNIVTSRLLAAYFPIPDITTIHFWNTTIFINDDGPMHAVIPALVFFLCSLMFIRKTPVFIFYVACTAGLMILYYLTFLIHARYYGHLLVALLISCWISAYFEETAGGGGRLALIGDNVRPIMIGLILLVNAVGGLGAYVKDLQHPFSSSKEMSAFLVKNHLHNLTIVGATDFVVSPVSAYLNKPIFYPERKEFGSFIIFDKKRNPRLQFSDIAASITHLNGKGEKRMLLILDSQPTLTQGGQTINLERGTLSGNIKISLIGSFKPGIVKDEKYYLYMVEPISQL